ncbi:MAG: hypothetical protein IJ518_04620 [Clostridia bacterium]|nr:hypothetical protein [Clostridia bacterium]
MAQNIQTEYQFPIKIASYDVGEGDRLRLSAVLRYQQEAAEQHLRPGGLGWKDLGEQGIAFVASRWHATIRRMPAMEEAVTLTTWHRERKGPRFLRCYEWMDAAGEVLIQGVMQFALVAVEDHRLLRGDEFMRLAAMPEPRRGVACTDPERFRLPAMETVGEYRVRRSDIDRNGHMNNTHYADLLWDFLPVEPAGRQPVDVQLHFAGESRLGDTLTMTAGTEGESLFVRGDHDRGSAFAARVVLGAADGI